MVFHNTRTNHIEVHYHDIRVWTVARGIDLRHVNTNVQIAAIFTQALGFDKLQQFLMSLELCARPAELERGVLTNHIECNGLVIDLTNHIECGRCIPTYI